MVRHVGEPHVWEPHHADHEPDVQHKESGREPGGTGQAAALPGADESSGREAGCSGNSQGARLLRRPARVHRHQVARPEEGGDVEPDRPRRDEEARPEGERRRHHFPRDVQPSHQQGEGEVRDDAARESCIEGVAPGPVEEDDDAREGRRGRLAQERGDREGDGEHPEAAAPVGARVVEPAGIGEERGQVEEEEQHVLPFGDPADARDRHGMERPEARRGPGGTRAQSERAPEQTGHDGVRGMQNDVVEVEEPGLAVGQPPLHVEGRKGHGVEGRVAPVLPGARIAVRAGHVRVLVHVVVVVPD